MPVPSRPRARPRTSTASASTSTRPRPSRTLKCVVTSAEKHLALAVSNAIQRVKAGTDKGANIVNDAKSDPVGIGISDFHDLKSMMTPDLQAKIDAALKGMKDGSVDPCKPVACDKP